ncbi:MAG: nucleotidyltransferase domain-containing protein [Candidatus Methanomethylophilaceae archaeon]|nr:nucleotidyltransferase domain-containing protein [Candidatus Methanomethylophilaceae archaeon]
MPILGQKRTKRGVYTPEEIATIVAPIASRYGTGRIYLFGSYGRGTANKDSDIDLLVEPGDIRGYLIFTQMNIELEKALGKSVDMVSAGCDDRFLSRINKDLVCIYG